MADHRPAEELYDVENDPWETRNLADDPGCAQIKKRLQKALTDWMLETRDTGLLPEPEMIRLAKLYGGEYNIFRRQPGGQARVKQLIQLAMTSSQLKKANQLRLETALALAGDDPAARYWAVLALRKNADAEGQLRHFARDENPSVRIAAAWSLALSGKQKEAVSILETELKQVRQQEEVLHFAMNVLNQCGPAAQSAMRTVQAVQQARGDSKYIGRLCETYLKQYDNPK